MKILFKNVRLLPEAIPEGAQKDGLFSVVVTDDTITYVGSIPPEDTYDRTVDGNENLLMPAFYNAHCHSAMTLFRGYGEDLPLRRWLDEKILPAEEKLNFRRVHYGSRLAIAEMIKNGVVAFNDMYMFQDATAEAVLEAGIKANLSRSIVSFDPDIKPEEDARFAESRRLYEQYHGAGNGRLKVDMSLHAEYSNVDACCRYVAEYAAEQGLRMQLHLSETEREHLECIERHGVTPAAYFAGLGVLDVPTTAAHCVWVSDEDIDILREKGVSVAHSPVSNLKLGSGIMPLRKMLDAGINVALGTDGVASNNALSVLRELQLTAILQKGLHRDPENIRAEMLPALATRNGALAMGREDCGAVAVGCKADLIMIDLNAINNIPCYDLATTLAYSADTSNVLLTMCDGRILWENGEYTSIDTECLRFEARQVIRHYFD
ncbi:MAG: amidohydrolase [Clostridia bacterium]|nr:amidohydrolase [Clostridia bacterium]